LLLKKKFITITIILIFLIIGIIFLYPLSFENIISSNDDLGVVYIKNVGSDGKPQHESTDYYYKSDSEEMKQIQQILRKYTYHRGLRSWSKNNLMEGENGSGYWLHLYFGENSIISGGTGEIIVNNYIYRIGYWGNKKAITLMEEIRKVLE